MPLQRLYICIYAAWGCQKGLRNFGCMVYSAFPSKNCEMSRVLRWGGGEGWMGVDGGVLRGTKWGTRKKVINTCRVSALRLNLTCKKRQPGTNQV